MVNEKSMTLSTTLVDLFGKERYAKHIFEGNSYWMYFDSTTDVYDITKMLWNEIKVTCIRSGVVFYEVVETKLPEKHFEIGSINSMNIVPYDLPVNGIDTDEWDCKLLDDGTMEFTRVYDDGKILIP